MHLITELSFFDLKSPMKKTIIAIISILVVLGGVFYFVIYPKLEIVSGYNAKILCSCLFVSEMDQAKAEAEDLGFSLLWLASNTVDINKKTIKTNVWGMHPKTAIYREGLGCTLVNYQKDNVFSTTQLNTDHLIYTRDIWPESEIKGNPKMQIAINKAFDDGAKNPVYRTRAVVVVKDGKIIGERYGKAFSKDSKLLGWSMTKSITSAMAGILAKDGFWDPSDPMPVQAWTADDRKNITLKQVLQQTTGLHWEEDYANVSTATKMLYSTDNMGKYAASQDWESQPGSVWEYSSGNSNILAETMDQAFDNNGEYLEFPHKALFAPIGARNFVIETDATNHYVGSSYGYAPGRDWAKVGLLYLNMGNWFGNQIIDSTWVKESLVPVAESSGKYGYQFWLNYGSTFENYSENAYWMNGFQGQQVSVHPEDNLVIVRIGVTYDQKDFPFDTWIKEIKAAAK